MVAARLLHVPGAAALRLTFDARCSLQQKWRLVISRDEAGTDPVAVITGGTLSHWSTLEDKVQSGSNL